MNEETLRKLLSIDDASSIEEAIVALSERASQVSGLNDKLQTLTDKVAELEATEPNAELEAQASESVKLTEKNKTLSLEKEALVEEVTKLSDRMNTFEQSEKKRSGEERIKLAIESLKITPTEVTVTQDENGKDVVPAMRTLAFESPAMFDSIVGGRSKVNLELTVEKTKDGEPEADPGSEYWPKVRAKTRELQAEDGVKFSDFVVAQSEARRLVEESDPDLVAAYKKIS